MRAPRRARAALRPVPRASRRRAVGPRRPAPGARGPLPRACAARARWRDVGKMRRARAASTPRCRAGQCDRGRVRGASAAGASRLSRWRRRSSSPPGIGIVYWATGSSVRLLAAELTADHVKCALMNRVLGTGHEHETAHRPAPTPRRSSAGWDPPSPGTPSLPDAPAQAGLELVGSRQCLFGQGTAAHIMYRDIRHRRRDGVGVHDLRADTNRCARCRARTRGVGLVRWLAHLRAAGP